VAVDAASTDKVRPLLAAAVGVVLASVMFAGAAAATESTIVPGVGIGKLKLGMTQAQVEKVLGKEYLVNERATVGGAPYRELAWNFSTWSVGFLRSGATWRVVQVETTLRAQRTLAGIGVGSPFQQVVREYSHVLCGGINWTFGPGYDLHGVLALILVSKGPIYTAFAIEPVDRMDFFGAWRVYAVVVQQALPSHTSLQRVQEANKLIRRQCSDGWRERGTPFRR